MKDISGGYTISQLTIGFAKEPPLFYADRPNYSSGVWKNFSVIYTASGAKVPNWFRCNIPDCEHPFVNCLLTSAHNKIKRHIDRHDLDDQSMQITRNQLSNALVEASRIGKMYGELSNKKLQSVLPATNIWSEEVIKLLEGMNIQGNASSGIEILSPLLFQT